MSEGTLVITGGNSYLGGTVVRALLAETNYKILSLVSLRWRVDQSRARNPRLQTVRVDLMQPLPAEVKEQVSAADRIIHFAWMRGKSLAEANRSNDKMIHSLMDAACEPSRFYFISSAAASPGALSIYGRSKFHAMNLVRERGGVSLVCGLVLDEKPQGPYRMLDHSVQKFPIALRFEKEGIKVYPIHIREVIRAIRFLCENALQPSCYRLFDEGVPLNDFLAMLERHHPGYRMPLRLSAPSVLALIAFLKQCHLGPRGTYDKLQTFLFKEPDYLATHHEIPKMKDAANAYD